MSTTSSDHAERLRFAEVAVLPEEGDNCAMASRDLPAGTRVVTDTAMITLPHRVPEGHRFAVAPVPAGGPLLSWNTAFATATTDLLPGDYVCTDASLDALRMRRIDGLPETATATNLALDPYRLDESALHRGEQVGPVTDGRTFAGFRRSNGTVGTRNHLVIMGVTSRSGAFATELARRLDAEHPARAGFDGVVPFAHTEAGEDTRPNNLNFVLAVLAGTLAHPNVGGVLLVDDPGAVISSSDVRGYLADHPYPGLIAENADFLRSAGFAEDLSAATRLVQPWFAELESARRSEVPVAELKIALQCGGSDAFSGVTANPLAGAVGREVIKRGGLACLAETDELIAAESYVLKNVRTTQVARDFLARIDAFKERVGWHGHTAEGNPSGGNVLRGLYNISLKSIGAARKLDRDVRLDHVIDYGRPFPGPGFVFMDSPGNDLESVAGQVASGSTMIFFTTGNGSITNFPYVPTMKFVTTTERYRLLSHEMDVNAGRYTDGEDFDTLTTEVLDQTLRVASGEHTAGERAGHSQVSIWRNWKQTRPRRGVSISISGRRPEAGSVEGLAHLRDAVLSGEPLLGAQSATAPTDSGSSSADLYRAEQGYATEQLALLLPTSLCSGQIAARMALEAEEQDWTDGRTTRAVALPHTEGCGVSGGANVDTYTRTMLGYLAHPNVGQAVLVEHGCEKTHNAFFRQELESAGLDPDRFGWVSIQLDGGIEAATDRAREWFAHRSAGQHRPYRESRSIGDLSVALDVRGPVTAPVAEALAITGNRIVAAGGTVVLPATSGLLEEPAFTRTAFGHDRVQPSLAHGQRAVLPGWHLMRMPTTDWLETATGLGATGAQLALVHVNGGTLPGHRFLPVLQVSSDPRTNERFGADLDGAVHPADLPGWSQLITDAASGLVVPKALQSGNVGFQLTRGLLGASM